MDIPLNHSKNSWLYWAESAEQNKSVIAEAIKPYLINANSALELGSGTGQHAVFFAEQYSMLQWQPSEHADNVEKLRENLRLHSKPNIREAIVLDAVADQWPTMQCDLFYSANTLHIMSWISVCQLFKHLGALLQTEQRALIYGPFRFADRPFAASNEAFNNHLKQGDPLAGIRPIEALKKVASENGIYLEKAMQMPANNHVLVWQRTSS